MMGVFLFSGFFGFATPLSTAALFAAIFLFLGGLTVAVLGAAVFLLRFAQRPPGE